MIIVYTHTHTPPESTAGSKQLTFVERISMTRAGASSQEGVSQIVENSDSDAVALTF